MKFLIALFVFFFNLNFINATQSIGSIRVKKGSVQLYRNNVELNIKLGTSVMNNDKIITSEKALVIIALKSGSKLKVESQSEVVLNDPYSEKGIELNKGSLFAQVKKVLKSKEKKSHFKVTTRSVVAGVRGTEFFTSYGSAKSSEDIWLCVNEGEVVVQNRKDKKEVSVKEGEGISVTVKGISSPRQLPWTKRLNWNMDPSEGEVSNTVNIEEAYQDLLDPDYE